MPYPTGNSSVLLEDGATFHFIFNARVKKTAIEIAEELKKLHFNKNAAIAIIDETCMILCEFLVLLDERLKIIHDPLIPFRGKYAVLCGNVLQIETIFGQRNSSNYY